jgi:hypothetical protein
VAVEHDVDGRSHVRGESTSEMVGVAKKAQVQKFPFVKLNMHVTGCRAGLLMKNLKFSRRTASNGLIMVPIA